MDNLFSLILDQLELGIIVLDKDYKITVWNGWLERLTGKTAKQVIGTKLTDVCSRLNSKLYNQIFQDAILHGKHRFCSGAMNQFFIRPADASRCPQIKQNMLVQPMEIGEARCILIQIFDITGQHQRVQQLKDLINELSITHQKLKASEEEIRHHAYHDFLTGLPNRLLLLDRVNLAIEHAQRNKNGLAVLFLDMDNFKLVNDTFGHAVGDQLLQDMALRLRNCVRKSDTVARLGGDEFVLLLPAIANPDSAAVIAANIIRTVVEPWVYKEQELFVCASVGISMFPKDGEDAEGLIKKADKAMFYAKGLGKNNYQFFNDAMYNCTNGGRV
ncbi:MAG: sensor domain-containing diguanylate cyclase [Firmicutes bacterium]|nr:sensor domain-containing diguanylate cyclase [Bacillota bacterium]